jgi:hypothetical protein
MRPISRFASYLPSHKPEQSRFSLLPASNSVHFYPPNKTFRRRNHFRQQQYWFCGASRGNLGGGLLLIAFMFLCWMGIRRVEAALALRHNGIWRQLAGHGRQRNHVQFADRHCQGLLARYVICSWKAFSKKGSFFGRRGVFNLTGAPKFRGCVKTDLLWHVSPGLGSRIRALGRLQRQERPFRHGILWLCFLSRVDRGLRSINWFRRHDGQELGHAQPDGQRTFFPSVIFFFAPRLSYGYGQRL